MDYKTPIAGGATITPAEVVALRVQVQQTLELGITAAQDWCAEAVCSKRRAWQQWERGERAIHPGIYKLARIEIARIGHTDEQSIPHAIPDSQKN